MEKWFGEEIEHGGGYQGFIGNLISRRLGSFNPELYIYHDGLIDQLYISDEKTINKIKYAQSSGDIRELKDYIYLSYITKYGVEGIVNNHERIKKSAYHDGFADGRGRIQEEIRNLLGL